MGRLWNMVLRDNKGKTKVIEALGIPEILKDTVGHRYYKVLARRFPAVSPKVFEELPEQKLDLLVGNANLLLQPKCATCVGCMDCLQNLCCYSSVFRMGMSSSAVSRASLGSKLATYQIDYSV